MSRHPTHHRSHPPRTGIRRIARPLVAVPVAVLLLAAAGAGAWAVLRDDDTDPAAEESTTEQLVEATVTDIDQTIAAEGTIEAETTADEAFAVSGTVAEVLVAAGDEVEAGAPLARISSSELEATVVEAQAALDDAEAALADATDADASDTEVAARQAQVDAATVDLVSAVEDLAGATLTAPVAGTVATVGYEVGDVLGTDGTDGTDMTGSDTDSGQSNNQNAQNDQDAQNGDDTATEGIQVISTGTYLVTTAVDATEVDQVEVGQIAHVTPTTSSSSSESGGFGPPGMGGPEMMMSGGDVPEARTDALAEAGETTDDQAAGAQVDGLVTSVGAVASADSGVATFPVEITVQGSPDEFFPGAVAEIEVVHDQVTDAVTIPAMAVSQEDGQATVTVADGDEREERAITTGVTSGVTIQVVEGLEAGEQVVITRPGLMVDGGPGGPRGANAGGPQDEEEGG